MSDDERTPETAGAPKPEHAERAPRAPRPRWRLALLAVGVVILAGSPWWGPLTMRRLAFFRVRHVQIVGTRYIAARELLDRLHIDTTASVWDPTAPLVRRVAGHPQVRSVWIGRRLPGTLVLHVDERMPLALVPGAKGFGVLDERGTLLPIDPSSTPVDAPVLAQRDMSALRLLADLRTTAPAMYQRISEVRPVTADELVIQFATVTVRAMKSVTAERLAEIEPVENDLAKRQLRVAELDLRYRDQVIARLP